MKQQPSGLLAKLFSMSMVFKIFFLVSKYIFWRKTSFSRREDIFEDNFGFWTENVCLFGELFRAGFKRFFLLCGERFELIHFFSKEVNFLGNYFFEIEEKFVNRQVCQNCASRVQKNFFYENRFPWERIAKIEPWAMFRNTTTNFRNWFKNYKKILGENTTSEIKEKTFDLNFSRSLLLRRIFREYSTTIIWQGSKNHSWFAGEVLTQTDFFRKRLSFCESSFRKPTKQSFALSKPHSTCLEKL